MPFVIVPAARDCVFVAALEGSGLISYQKASGTFLHALLRALSLERFDPGTGQGAEARSIKGGGQVTLTSPLPCPDVYS